VDLLGVGAGEEGEADHRVFVDAAEAAGLADANALLEVGEDGDGLVLGEAGVEQRGAVAFAEAVLAGATGQTATLLVLAVAEGDAEVAVIAAAKVRAVGVVAAEVLQIVHGASYQKQELTVAMTLPLRYKGPG
jgi:hypothetical protein